MSICYLVGAGEFYGDFKPNENDLVIAADGGYEALTGRGIRCDVLIGDMDSIKEIPAGVEILRHKVEKDETDMHLAYLEGRKRGFSEFKLYGGVGGRPDHTFANYCLLSYIKNDGNNATLIGDGYIAYTVKKEVARVRGKAGDGISIFAFGGDCEGVRIKGLYYELDGGRLTSSFPLGVSNHFAEETAEISTETGTLLVIQKI